MTTKANNPTRRGLLASGAAAATLPLWARYTNAQSAEPIKVGFQVHRTGIGAAYGRWYDPTTEAAVKLINEAGVNVQRTPEAVLRAQLDAWDNILPELMKDPFFAKVVESQKEWTKRVAFYVISNEIDKKLAFNHYFPGVLKS